MSLPLIGSLVECVHSDAQVRSRRASSNVGLVPKGMASARPLKGLDERREASCRMVCCAHETATGGLEGGGGG